MLQADVDDFEAEIVVFVLEAQHREVDVVLRHGRLEPRRLAQRVVRLLDAVRCSRTHATRGCTAPPASRPARSAPPRRESRRRCRPPRSASTSGCSRRHTRSSYRVRARARRAEEAAPRRARASPSTTPASNRTAASAAGSRSSTRRAPPSARHRAGRSRSAESTADSARPARVPVRSAAARRGAAFAGSGSLRDAGARSRRLARPPAPLRGDAPRRPAGRLELVDREILARGQEARIDGERRAETRVGLVAAARAGQRDAEQVERLEILRCLREELLERADGWRRTRACRPGQRRSRTAWPDRSPRPAARHRGVHSDAHRATARRKRSEAQREHVSSRLVPSRIGRGHQANGSHE